MSKLQLFMKKNKKVKENLKYPATKSLVDEDGKPLEWELKAITTKEQEAIRDECTKEVPAGRGQVRHKVDTGLYTKKLIAASVVFPDLMNAELQDSYGVSKPEDLLVEMVDNAGEYSKLAEVVTDHSGFTDINEEVEEAKN